MEGDAGSGSTKPGPSRNSGSTALILALNEMCDGKRWYTSTKELQLASLEFCIACRKHQKVHLRVNERTPRTLLAAVDASPPHPKRLCRTRVPRLRARSVKWDMPTATELRTPILALNDVDSLEFGVTFNGSLEAVIWPQRLKSIAFLYSQFNQPIDAVQWPASLQKLDLGDRFNQPIEGVEFPPSLQRLMFCSFSCFNQPIANVVLPTSLQYLDMGGGFNHPIEDVRWPPSLQHIVFGEYFDQRIEDVVWPASLRKLTFGDAFDLPIERATFPASLQEVAFGTDFSQPIEDVTWPDSLQTLFFGHDFNEPIDNVMWPASLEEVSFGLYQSRSFEFVVMYSEFNQPIDVSAWPASMRRLTLGHKFRQSLQGLGTWMPNLEGFRILDWKCDSVDDSLLRGIEWPKGLRQLYVLRDASLDGVNVPPTVEVLRLENDSEQW